MKTYDCMDIEMKKAYEVLLLKILDWILFLLSLVWICDYTS